MTVIDYDWPLPSDHCSIHSSTTFTKPRYETVVRSSRKIRHANIDVLASMIESMQPVMDPLCSGVSRLVEKYNIKMKAVIDKVAPLVMKSYLVKPRAPWFNASHLEKHRRARCLDRRFLPTGKVIDRHFQNGTKTIIVRT